MRDASRKSWLAPISMALARRVVDPIERQVEAPAENGGYVGQTRPQPLSQELGDQAVILEVLAAVKSGDFSVRMPLEWTGVAGKIADHLNDVIAANQTLGKELTRVSRVVGKEGKLSQRIPSRGSGQAWAESIESVNSLIDDIVRPTSEMQRVIGAVADGDLSKKITADVHGEMLELKSTINGDGRPAQPASSPRSPAWPARSGPRASSARPRP